MHITIAPAADQPAPRRMLACPACDSQRVVLNHLACRALSPLAGEVAIGRNGLRVDPSAPAPEGGASVALHATCEHGHAFLVRFRQMRGATCVDRLLLPWSASPAQADLN